MSALLNGRTAVVTGASRGIGLSISRSLAECGVRVAMLARGKDELQQRAAEIGSDAIPIVCDVGAAEAVDEVTRELHTLFGGAPSILVNNAGLFRVAPVEHTTADDFIRTLEVNLIAPFLLVRAFMAEMKSRGSGHVVNIGSIADRAIFPDNSAYSASKFGVRALTATLRAELRGTGVRVTLVSPGPVDTPLWDQIAPDGREGFTPRSAMLGADSVAAAVLYALTQPAEVDVEEIRLGRS